MRNKMKPSTLVLTLLVAVLVTTTATLVAARVATDVAHGDSLPLFSSFRLGSFVKTHRRPMARRYHPIVGVHRVSTIPAFHESAAAEASRAFEAAHKDTNLEDVVAEGGDKATTVSVMFHVGRMGARTPWLPLTRAPVPPQPDITLEFLEQVQIFFDTVPNPEGHPTSSVTRLTFATRYSPTYRNLTLEYVWREQRSYNPEAAISVAGVVAIVCVCILSVVMFSGRDALRRELVVKIRDE